LQLIEYKISIPKKFDTELEDFLNSLNILGYYEILFDSSIPKNPNEGILRDNTTYRVYVAREDQENDLKLSIFLKAYLEEDAFFERGILETKDYEESYKEFYHSFQAGDKLWVVPVWEKDTTKLPDGHKALLLNPGIAFGTGHHETTQMLLKKIASMNWENTKIADLGMGTGILSIACALLGAKRIVGVDIDPNAVRAAKENFNYNNYPSLESVLFEEGGLDFEEVLNSSWDVVLANITFGVLSQNIHNLKKIKTKKFLFSGIITERKEEWEALMNEHLGGKTTDGDSRNGWELVVRELD
jgi:ribosomal protein L11 methyltransferase